MKNFKKNRIIKIIAFCLVLILASQQIAWAETIDLLKEGNLENSDIILALIAGFTQAMAVNPSWTTTQVFTYTYLVPKATDMVVKTLDIKDPILRAGLEMGISMGASNYFDLTVPKPALKPDVAKAAGAEAGKEVGKEAAQQVTKVIPPLRASLLKAAQGAVYGATRELLYLNLKKYNKDWARFLSYSGATLIGKYTGIWLSKQSGIVFDLAKEVDPNTGRERGTGIIVVKLEGKVLDEALREDMQQFWRDFKVGAAGGLVETLAATQGYKEAGIFLSAGVTRMLANRLSKQEREKRILVCKQEKKVYEDDLSALNAYNKDKKLLTAEQEKRLKELGVLDDPGRLGSMIERRQLMIKFMDQQIHQLNMSEQEALFEGIKSGAISAFMQKVSLQTKSPVHGAYFNLFASSVLKAALVKDEYVFGLPQGATLENMDTPALMNLVQRRKDYGFYAMMISTSITNALADIMSLGRATPYLNKDGTFDLNWHNPNDVFYMGRYYDYLKDYSKYGFSGALMNQFISGLHYQSVTNVKDILSGAIQRPYVLVSSRPSMQERKDVQKNLESAINPPNKLDHNDPLVIKARKALENEKNQSLNPFHEPMESIAKFIETAEAEKDKKLTDEQKKYIDGIKEAMRSSQELYRRDLAAWGAPGGQGVWKVLNDSYGREAANYPDLTKEARDREAARLGQGKTKEEVAKIREEISQKELVRLDSFSNVIGPDREYYQKYQGRSQPPPTTEIEFKLTELPKKPTKTEIKIKLTEPIKQPAITWTWAQLLQDNDGQTLGISRQLRYSGGVVPQQNEKLIRDKWTQGGIEYGLLGEDTAVYFDKKDNSWRAVYDPDPAYDPIVDKSFGGSYRKYAQGIIGNLTVKGELSNPDEAVKFSQHNPWLIEKVMAKKGISQEKQDALRKQLGIAHLHREEVRALNEYGLDTNTGKVYRKEGNNWVYERDATPGEIRHYQIYGDKYRADGMVNIRTGQAKLQYK